MGERAEMSLSEGTGGSLGSTMWGHPTSESARATATPHAERHARSSNFKGSADPAPRARARLVSFRICVSELGCR